MKTKDKHMTLRIGVLEMISIANIRDHLFKCDGRERSTSDIIREAIRGYSGVVLPVRTKCPACGVLMERVA